MTRCNGRCNQGRTCTCFEEGHRAELSAFVGHLLAALALAGVFVSWGFFWGFLSVSQDCDLGQAFEAFGRVYECRAVAR